MGHWPVRCAAAPWNTWALPSFPSDKISSALCFAAETNQPDRRRVKPERTTTMMAAARMAFASCGRLHLLLPSSPSTSILAMTGVGYGGIAKPISFLAPSSAARSTRNSASAHICSCSSSSSDATVAPAPPQPAVEEKKPAPAPVEAAAAGAEDKGEVPVGDLAGLLDIRVGRVVKAWRHPEADTLYVEEVDVGEEQPRTICSGLVNYLSLEQLQDSNVIVLANLKPRNMRGIKSNGMLMCASDASHETVELLTPPEGSLPGERVWFGSEDEKNHQSEPATANQVQKKKIWESVQPHLRTTDHCIAALGEHPMCTSAGKVFCKSLQGAGVS